VMVSTIERPQGPNRLEIPATTEATTSARPAGSLSTGRSALGR
jgi:hypothetical protein